MNSGNKNGLASYRESMAFSEYRPISAKANRRRLQELNVRLFHDSSIAENLSPIFHCDVSLDYLEDVYFVYLGEKNLPRGLMFFNRCGEIYGLSSMAASPQVIESLIKQSEVVELENAFLAGDRFTRGNMCHVAYDHACRAHIAQDSGYSARELYFLDTSWPWSRTLVADLFGDINYLASNTIYHFSRLGFFSNLTEVRDQFLHPLAQFDCGFTERVQAHVKSITGTKANGRRLYINRLGAKARSIANENEIISFLESRDYESHAPELLEYQEQLSLFHSASEIIAPHGAGLTNIIACTPGTRLTEIFLDNQGTWAYETMSHKLGLEYGRIDLTTNEGGVDIDEFSRLLSGD